MNEKNTINYAKSLKNLNNLSKFSGSMDLKNIKSILKIMGDFQNELNVIHISGTNGKGSILRFLENIYLASDYSVGVFTSPEVIEVTKHIRINGKNISGQDFATSFFKVQDKCDEASISLSQFEMLTVISLLEMYEKSVDIALIEVGIGSALDATNVFKKKTTVFSKIDVDHEKLLGNTPEEVAMTKAEIITEQGKVVLGTNTASVSQIIEKKAKSMNCEFYTSKNLKLSYNNMESYQNENADTALAVVEALKDDFPIEDDVAILALKQTKTPLRLEWLGEHILLDSAHNMSGINALKDYLYKEVKPKKIICVFGVLTDKKPEKILEIVKSFSDELILTRPLNQRAYDFSSKEDYISDYKEAIELGIKKTKDEILLICGSFYLTAHAKKYLESRNKN